MNVLPIMNPITRALVALILAVNYNFSKSIKEISTIVSFINFGS